MKISNIKVKGTEITILNESFGEFISLTDMLRAKDGDFFVSDWLRNRNTVEFLGIWESVNNPSFNYGEFAIIRSQAGLNNYKISVKRVGCENQRHRSKSNCRTLWRHLCTRGYRNGIWHVD